MRHASLFSGIGGPEIAAAMLGWENVFHCEINPFGRRILEYWFPNSDSYEDIKTTDFTKYRGGVDILTGGFPCQPFSYAGQRRGADDDRYLWPQMLRAIEECRPTWVVGENVAGITTMVEQGTVSSMECQGSLFDEGDGVQRYRQQQTFTIQRVCTDLEGLGYAVQPLVIPACAVGAPHRRDRVFIVGRRIATDTDDRADRRAAGEDAGESREERLPERHEVRQPDEPNQIRPEAARTPSDTACGREGASRKSGSLESDGGNTHQQPIQWRTASEWSDRFYAILRHAANTPNARVERMRRERQNAIHRPQHAANADSDRGREIHQHLQSQQPNGAKPFSNGGQRNVADTSHEGLGRAVHQGEWREVQLELMQRSGVPDSASGEIAGCGRWANFPTVSPVHRGNDGIPFDVDNLSFPFDIGDKDPFVFWRTESLKAYGNAIVPQVMYEIFRAIQIVSEQCNTK